MELKVKNTYYRWSGICIILGATLLTIGYWLRPYIEKQFTDDFAGGTALLSSQLVTSGILILMVGLPALFARQIVSLKMSGMIAAALTFAGLAAFHLGTVALYFVLPVLVKHSTETRALVAQDVPPFPRFALFWAISLLIQVIGLVWYSIKAWQAKVFPRATALLTGLGALLLIASPIVNFRMLQPATTLILIGITWCGWTMLRGTNSRSQDQRVAHERNK